MGQIAQKHNKNLQHQVESARDTSGYWISRMRDTGDGICGTNTWYNVEDDRKTRDTGDCTSGAYRTPKEGH